MRARGSRSIGNGKILGKVADLLRRYVIGMPRGTVRTENGAHRSKTPGRWGMMRLLRGLGSGMGTAESLPKPSRGKRRGRIGDAALLDVLEPKVLLSAVIATNQSDYHFGSTAIITGSGFAANEVVQLQVLHAPGTGGSNNNPQNQPWDVTADASGNVNTSWVVNEADAVGATFDLTAVGQTSGETAETEFTDSGLSVANRRGRDFGGHQQQKWERYVHAADGADLWRIICGQCGDGHDHSQCAFGISIRHRWDGAERDGYGEQHGVEQY